MNEEKHTRESKTTEQADQYRPIFWSDRPFAAKQGAKKYERPYGPEGDLFRY